MGTIQFILTAAFIMYQLGYHMGNQEYLLAGINFILAGIMAKLFHQSVKFSSDFHKKTYTRKDLIRAQEIYHENYQEEPDVFAPIFTKAGATYHMNYILGIIDSKSYKMRMTVPDPPLPRKITTEG
ncbi:hypothetical protein [Gramella sp. Hel_I_59]|uniref:hypothetical protein n=1 Tax=Gramella sp. Hel_I_59 TaxID=1249978 RepID=UPI001150AB08|nr:hypothetical protein [Gramella sp. Hel_I_59]